MDAPARGLVAETVGDLAPSPVDEPRANDPTRVYELPTARRVVASGLSLALASTSELRRASIYIGLLMLGAFGPAIVALLLILGRLGDGAGDVFGGLFLGPEFGGPPVSPAVEAALLVVLFELLLGLLLFVSISIDAQVIAIAILGGRAAERPLRLWESIIRARQTFWRMAASGTLVGIVGLVVQGLVVAGIDAFSQSAEASGVAGALLATVIMAPLAYVSTSVVLGDVGAMEALSRSWRLYRARRLLAVVVVLFTFVTSAIHLFALGAGVDLVARAADILHVSVTEGAAPFAIAVALILAVVVAYGSLTFTIGAIVAAPQVTGFLGLTFYSGGLDKARLDSPKPPRGFRYVSRPMLVTLVALAGIVALEIPAINSIEPPPTSASLQLVRTAAEDESDLIEVYGSPDLATDVAGDGGGPDPASIDIVQAEAAWVEDVPDWLLARFDCTADAVRCGGDSGADPFDDGGYLFLHRFAAPLVADGTATIAVLLALDHEVTATSTDAYGSYLRASRVFISSPGGVTAVTAMRTSGTELQAIDTAARAAWSGADLWTLVPAIELPFEPLGWDVVAIRPAPAADTFSRDGLRASWTQPLRVWDVRAAIFIDDLRRSPSP